MSYGRRIRFCGWMEMQVGLPSPFDGPVLRLAIPVGEVPLRTDTTYSAPGFRSPVQDVTVATGHG